MKLIYKINLIAVGISIFGAVLAAMGGNLWLALFQVALAYYNWHIASASEKGDE